MLISIKTHILSSFTILMYVYISFFICLYVISVFRGVVNKLSKMLSSVVSAGRYIWESIPQKIYEKDRKWDKNPKK